MACLAEARAPRERRLERETGIEPATNSLEGCDSTTELLPLFAPNPVCVARDHTPLTARPRLRRSPSTSAVGLAQDTSTDPGLAMSEPFGSPMGELKGESNGGEGRTRTFEAARATDLQSAAFDRFATSPTFCCMECAAFGTYRGRKSERWSWRRELNPRPADYKSAALPTELRQPDKSWTIARPMPDAQTPSDSTTSTACSS